jgi:Tol biopolymer transport system component
MNESTFRSLFHQAIGEVEVPAHLVAAVNSRGRTATRSRPRGGRNWDSLMVAAAAFLAIAIVAGLMATRLMNHPTVGKPASQLCIPGATQPSDRFARVHGCITYYDGTQIVAVDPYHPANRIFLGASSGRLPVAWSRDGRRLLLASSQGDLYVMNTDGSQTRLTSLGKSTEGSFSPDGTKVVYSRQDDGLYVVDANGGTPRLISKSYAMTLGLESPAWSPDGLRIAYMVYLESQGRTYQLWTVNPDGTNSRQLVAQGGSGGLSWSPDGSMLAFDSGPGSGIYVVHADGSGVRHVNDNGTRPSWSPNGSRLAFIRGAEMFTMAPDGGDLTLVKDVVVAPPSRLAWNPVAQPLDRFALAHGYPVAWNPMK